MTKQSLSEKIDLIETRLGALDNRLSEEQADFVLHPLDSPCYLNACPGSGKTEVVGIKAAYEIANWKDNFSGMAVLSFTKNAAKEISNRVKKYGGASAIKHPHFIGTIDAWLHGYILQPFGHRVVNYQGKDGDKTFRIIKNDERLGFLTSFNSMLTRTRKKDTKNEKFKIEIKVNDYYYENINVLSLQSQNRTFNPSTLNLQKIEIENLEKKKKKFLRAGLSTYADAEFLSHRVLVKYEEILQLIAKRFKTIIIDECQDLSCNQLAILKILYNNGVSIHFAGDNDQSIYEFKRVFVSEIQQFIQYCQFQEKALTLNFRSEQNIVNVCYNLVSIIAQKTGNKIQSNQPKKITQNCLLWEYETDGELSQLPQKFIDYIQQLNQQTATTLDLNECCVLARGHGTLNKFRSQADSKIKNPIKLIANGINCWFNRPRTGKDMQNALEHFGKGLCMLFYKGKGNPQNQYCPDGYTFIGWRDLLGKLLIELENSAHKIYPFSSLNWSKWTANLKFFLESHHNNFESTNDWNLVKGKIISPKGFAKKLVADSFKSTNTPYSQKIRMTTFHDIKGESLDAALVVSSKTKSSKGGHYEHWISKDNREEEYTRFAYVASSRPRHLLIWAVPKIKDTKIRAEILKLGFEAG